MSNEPLFKPRVDPQGGGGSKALLTLLAQRNPNTYRKKGLGRITMRAKMRRIDKPIVYEAHATRRMNQRGISTDQAERTVRNPDQQREAEREGATRFEKRLSNRRRLAVIADEETVVIRVVTAFWM